MAGGPSRRSDTACLSRSAGPGFWWRCLSHGSGWKIVITSRHRSGVRLSHSKRIMLCALARCIEEVALRERHRESLLARGVASQAPAHCATLLRTLRACLEKGRAMELLTLVCELHPFVETAGLLGGGSRPTAYLMDDHLLAAPKAPETIKGRR